MSRLRQSIRGDEGQLTLLVMGFAAIAARLVVVAVDASAVFLARRGLASAADAAATAAVQSIDEAAFYTGSTGDVLPLTNDGPTGVPVVVEEYADRLADRYPGLAMAGATPDGRIAVVEARRVVRLLFAAVLGVDAVTVTATATARAPLTE